jgi:hypothetical protein
MSENKPVENYIKEIRAQQERLQAQRIAKGDADGKLLRDSQLLGITADYYEEQLEKQAAWERTSKQNEEWTRHA